MKKFISLLVALTIILSCSAIAAAAMSDSYPDAADVQYYEAVEKLLTLKVVNGLDGRIAPQGNVTREQAAKIVVYMMMGPVEADKIVAKYSPFSDVDVNRWSAGCIAFCVQLGIIDGMGDGTFRPTGHVTGEQFLKMLLTALGYGADGFFTGEDWADKVAEYNSRYKLTKGNSDYRARQAANREEAMLYAYNALFTEQARGGTLAAQVFGLEEDPHIPIKLTATHNVVFFDGEYGEISTLDEDGQPVVRRTYIVYADGVRGKVTFDKNADGFIAYGDGGTNDPGKGFYKVGKYSLIPYDCAPLNGIAIDGLYAERGTISSFYNGTLTLNGQYQSVDIVITDDTPIIDLTGNGIEWNGSLSDNNQSVTIGVIWKVNENTTINEAVAIYVLDVVI